MVDVTDRQRVGSQAGNGPESQQAITSAEVPARETGYGCDRQRREGHKHPRWEPRQRQRTRHASPLRAQFSKRHVVQKRNRGRDRNWPEPQIPARKPLPGPQSTGGEKKGHALPWVQPRNQQPGASGEHRGSATRARRTGTVESSLERDKSDCQQAQCYRSRVIAPEQARGEPLDVEEAGCTAERRVSHIQGRENYHLWREKEQSERKSRHPIADP